ncbi:MAG: hypothetical protein ACRD12_17075 [Acidimicrobiales bacterium]
MGDDEPEEAPVPIVVVRYKTKPERADENQQLIEKVFAELDAMGATGFGYASLRLEDGVSFVHVAVEEDTAGSVSLADVPAFQAFTAGIADRCDEPPVAMGATLVGAHRLFGRDITS